MSLLTTTTMLPTRSPAEITRIMGDFYTLAARSPQAFAKCVSAVHRKMVGRTKACKANSKAFSPVWFLFKADTMDEELLDIAHSAVILTAAETEDEEHLDSLLLPLGDRVEKDNSIPLLITKPEYVFQQHPGIQVGKLESDLI